MGRGEAGFIRVHNISGYWGGEGLVLLRHTKCLAIGEAMSGWLYKGVHVQHIWPLCVGGGGDNGGLALQGHTTNVWLIFIIFKLAMGLHSRFISV